MEGVANVASRHVLSVLASDNRFDHLLYLECILSGMETIFF